MVHHDVAVEGGDDAILAFFELDVGVVEGLQTSEIAVGKLLVLFAVEVAGVEQGVGCQQIGTEPEAVAKVDVGTFLFHFLEL